jgi:aspartyl-tRNA(Asn)/glutamyl-tRNA(Gln) amidotransferase subunit A
VLHAPVVTFPTPTIEETDIGTGEAAAKLLARMTRLTRPANYLGLPAVCANAGFSASGMPIGMQLLARPWDETSALRAGHAFQQATDFHLRAPRV